MGLAWLVGDRWARRSPPGGWPPTVWASPGFPLRTAMPPLMRRWPRTSLRANSPAPAGCVVTSRPVPGSSTGWWSRPSATTSARSSWARLVTTVALSGTPSPVSAGSRSISLPPSRTSASGWTGSGLTAPRCSSSRPTSPPIRSRTGSPPRASIPASAPCSCSRAWRSTWSCPCWSASCASSARSDATAACWPSACRPQARAARPGPVSRPPSRPGGAVPEHPRRRPGHRGAGPYRLARHGRRQRHRRR